MKTNKWIAWLGWLTIFTEIETNLHIARQKMKCYRTESEYPTEPTEFSNTRSVSVYSKGISEMRDIT